MYVCLSQSAPQSKRRRVAGLPNYAPGVEPGGEVALQRLKNQMRHADEGGRQELLDVSFAARREAVIKGTPLPQLMSDYPGIFSKGGVSGMVDLSD